eukprot:gene3718-4286_t
MNSGGEDEDHEDDQEEEEEEEEEEESEAGDDDGSDEDYKDDEEEEEEEEQMEEEEVFRMQEDYLIPVKVIVVNGIYKLHDSLLWNLSEEQITPEQYAKNLCTELDYPEWFETLVASTINNQIITHREIMRKLDELLPSLGSELLVPVFLDLTVNGLNLKDQFDWDLLSSNSVEAFARSLCLDLGLSREFENAISFVIREQIQYYYQQLTLNPQRFPNRPPIQKTHVIRNEFELPLWSPFVQRQGQWYPQVPQQQIRR